MTHTIILLMALMATANSQLFHVNEYSFYSNSQSRAQTCPPSTLSAQAIHSIQVNRVTLTDTFQPIPALSFPSTAYLLRNNSDGSLTISWECFCSNASSLSEVPPCPLSHSLLCLFNETQILNPIGSTCLFAGNQTITIGLHVYPSTPSSCILGTTSLSMPQPTLPGSIAVMTNSNSGKVCGVSPAASTYGFIIYLFNTNGSCFLEVPYGYSYRLSLSGLQVTMSIYLFDPNATCSQSTPIISVTDLNSCNISPLIGSGVNILYTQHLQCLPYDTLPSPPSSQVAIGVTVGICALVIIVIILIVYIRKRRPQYVDLDEPLLNPNS